MSTIHDAEKSDGTVHEATADKPNTYYPGRTPASADLYRLPWSKNDNPVGWVEITDICNLSCLGCYRHNGVEGHKPLEKIKDEILYLKKIRNITNVHLAGGEPLIHPDIVAIIDFIRRQGLNPVVITNGKRLDMELLLELKNAGCSELSFHVDSGQGREGWEGKNELEMCQLRQHYVDLISRAGGMNCNFNMTVSIDNFKYIPEILTWILGNEGMISGITLIPLRGMVQDNVEYVVWDRIIQPESSAVGGVAGIDPANFSIKSTDISSIISEHFPQYEPSAYLGGTLSHDSFKWLIAKVLCSDREIIGSVGPITMEMVQTLHHLFKGRYYAGGRGDIGRGILFFSIFDSVLRKALSRILKEPSKLFGFFRTLSIVIVQPPDMLDSGAYDMCDGCPDITLYKGELVHSCRLEEFRLYGQYAVAKKKG